MPSLSIASVSSAVALSHGMDGRARWPCALRSLAFWRIHGHMDAGSSRSGRNILGVVFSCDSPMTAFFLRTTLFQSKEHSARCWSMVASSTVSSSPVKRKEAAVISEMMSRKRSNSISASSPTSSVNLSISAWIFSLLTLVMPKVLKASIISSRSRDPPPSLSIISKSSETRCSKASRSATLPMMRTSISLSCVAFAVWYFCTIVLKRTLLTLARAMRGTE
mmetsp:Transcript_858/g.2128  ORF Transcript_858/g.2128 Transcript_858/m.2128 type:complete len:221 (+) Transcript_858:871-1533(+)